MEAFGECSKALYKFYVRKTSDGSYYGVVNKLAGTEVPELIDFSQNENKSYAFKLNDVNSASADKRVILADVESDKAYSSEIYDMTIDLESFTEEYLNNNAKSVIYGLEDGK